MNIGSGSGCWKSGDVLPEQFPVGLRVLVVDDDPTCLAIIKKMLWKCRYQVTACKAAEVALSLLRQNKNGFDIVLSDVHMPDMNGFKLLEHIGLEMDIPVIMMSADDNKEVVMEGVTHGAYDYLIKPLRIESLRNIWQHIVRKRRREWMEAGDRQQKASQDVDHSCSESWKNSKKRKEEEEEAEERDDTSSPKKPRVVWSVELHQQFVLAVHQLGIDKAVPKKILELMNVPGLTRENVASHLQKYRLYLRRVSGVSPHQNEMNNFNRLDLQAIATINQIPTQGFATLQAAAALGRFTSKSTIPMPLVDQRNPFSLENSSVRFPQRQQLTHLLHGIPTTIELKQLPNLHHPSQFMLTPQAQPMVNLLVNLSKELQSNNFSLGGNSSGMSTLTNRGMLQEEANSDIRGSRGFPSNYDIVNQLHQPQLQNWGLQNVGSTSGTCHHPSMQGTRGVSSQQLLQQGIPAHNNGQNRNIAVGKLICSDGEQSGDANLMGGSQLNSVGGNIAERFPGSDHQSTDFLGEFGEGDLISIYLQQQRKKG